MEHISKHGELGQKIEIEEMLPPKAPKLRPMADPIPKRVDLSVWTRSKEDSGDISSKYLTFHCRGEINNLRSRT